VVGTTAKLVVEHPGIVGLMKRVTATPRMRDTVETAIANPEYVDLAHRTAQLPACPHQYIFLATPND